MAGSFTAASFQPPAADPASANPSRYPSHVLLDRRAYFADRDNATTVKATTSRGHDVKVTFCLADPPAISYFCVHFPGISVHECCATEPRVVSSADDLALLCFAFRTGAASTDEDSHHLEYFVYKAASAGNQSIRPVPRSPPGYRHQWHAAIVPREGDSFLVADLSSNRDLGHYNLHIFSSETNDWSTKHLRLQAPISDVLLLPRDLPTQTDKVISLGESTVGWVDLWRGIVVCDVLHKEPILRFLPLPKPMVHRESQAWPARDVTGYPNGFINFIEIESCFRWGKFIQVRSFKTTAYLDFLDTIHDTELLEHHEMDSLDNEIKCVPDGWKIRTCFRSISWDHWRKGHIVRDDDISADPQHAKVLPHLWNSGAQKCRLNMLKTTPGFPTFGIYDIDFVYLMFEVGVNKKPWVFGVDIEKESLDVIKPYCASRAPYSDQTFKNTFISCVFSAYLNTAPKSKVM
ncbi:uncharacterized protein [Triticum aestivum]|uniref:uncharacterized protein n=1 Tax=Triticum aestivum TaxID=4565 RepID=UPI001D00824D|nr:uncharacterized protein LOC123040481 [Triticum aestivum]